MYASRVRCSWRPGPASYTYVVCAGSLNGVHCAKYRSADSSGGGGAVPAFRVLPPLHETKVYNVGMFGTALAWHKGTLAVTSRGVDGACELYVMVGDSFVHKQVCRSAGAVVACAREVCI